jgi:hypothetical protein
VLVEERLELGTGWLIDDILSERRRKGGHNRSISAAPPTRKAPHIGNARRPRGLSAGRRIRTAQGGLDLGGWTSSGAVSAPAASASRGTWGRSWAGATLSVRGNARKFMLVRGPWFGRAPAGESWWLIRAWWLIRCTMIPRNNH